MDTKRFPCIGLAGAAATLWCCIAPAEDKQSLASAFRQTKPIVELRLRSENVDQEGMDQAQALTLRSRIGAETGKAWNTSLLAEGELISPLASSYDSTLNGKHQYPVVADPQEDEINRLQLTNTTLPHTTIALGRQRIVLDDQRFLANVGWRQNEQTYDAVRVTAKPVAALSIDAAYINQVNRVFGKDSPVGRYHGDSYALNASYRWPVGTLTAFAYLLDFNEAPKDSLANTGVRFAGARPLRSVTLGYSGSWARQTDYAHNPLQFRADYYATELSATVRELTIIGGFETLEGDGTKGFSTPLATLHKFQGWADKFLTTPPNGIVDRYAGLSWTTKRAQPLETLAASITYHGFDAEHIALDYGTEIDLQLEGRYKHVRALLKYAGYNAAGFATDTKKYWAQMEYML